MNLKKICTTSLVAVLSFALVEVSFSLNANAGMIPTGMLVADLSRAKNKEKVAAFLQRQDVQKELIQRGISPAEASVRIAALSDFELQTLAGNIDNAPAGADVIVISLTTILLVILILLLIGRL